ncbi:MAG: carbohydrate kinase family protein [Pseudomonadota bacterium]
MNQRSGIVCAGNWIVDIVHDIPAWPNKSDLVVIAQESVGIGGGAANVALNLAGLNVSYPIVPVGLLGGDEHGQTVFRICRDAGLPTEGLVSLAGVSTAHTHVMNVPGDSRTFFYCPGANDHLGPDSISMESIASASPKLFYLGYLNLLPLLDKVETDGISGAAQVLKRARDAGMVSCVDLVSSQSETYQQTVFATLPEIDWLLLNEVEAARATGIAIANEADRDGMAKAAEALMDGGVHEGCILHSPQLSLWKTRREEIWTPVQPIPSTEIISAVGAGDAFASGVLHGLHEAWSPQKSVDLGNALAAACLRAPTATGGTLKLTEFEQG